MAPRWLPLLAATGCAPPVTGTATPRPTAPIAPTTPPAAPAPEVTILPLRTIRDLQASTEPPGAALSWSVDGEDGVADGPRVPARAVVPGQRWTVTATWDDGGTATATTTIPEPPGGNVLVLLLDDVGIDHVGACGTNPLAPPTPRIDALAAQGVRFDRAYASPVCSPTRAILLTGRHARRHGVGWIVDTGTRDFALPLEAITVAEALDHAWPGPWPTAALGKWHVAGPLYEGLVTHPNDQGFDHYAGSPGNPKYAEGFGYWVWDKLEDGVITESTTYMTTDTVDDAVDRIATTPEPWFLYVAFNAAHTPLSPPPPELTTLDVTETSTEQELFDATVEALDTEIGRLLDTIDPGVLGRTTVMVIGDNGTPEHAIDPPIDPTHAKHTVFEPGIRVPFVVTGPQVAVPGSVSHALVHVADVTPTVLELAGVPLGGPDEALVMDLDVQVPLDGRSLLPQLADPDAPGRDRLYVEAFTPNGPADERPIDRRILRDDRYKLMRLGADEQHFFDLWADPAGFDDGPDLLPDLADDEARQAWERLSLELDTLEQTLVYEGF